MDKAEAIKIIKYEFGKTHKVELAEENDKAFVFYCKAKNPNLIPSGIIVALNKSTKKTGLSIISVEEAINACIE